ncbi:MAG TPA: NTP transferase domain-containing protein [Pirellulaceae bacterium]|nr:NTP transferase domain-containing protein [Pirellulaceae bacterium]
MATTLAVVELWPAIHGLSPRSPLAGIARRRFAGKTLLEWLVRRVSDAISLDQIVALPGNDARSRDLVAHCPPDISVLHSSADDPLGRLSDAVREIPCTGVVRINICHPFVDPDLIDRLVAAAADSGRDYAGYALADGRPAIESQLGVFAEWCSAAAILRADRLAESADDRAEATRFLYSRPDLFALKWIPAPRQLDKGDLRLAIHDEEDWEHVQLILDALGPESLDWQYIASLLDRQPMLRARMADRNRGLLTA